jgi:DNA-binding transcriptional regulator YhcF (GntR family)
MASSTDRQQKPANHSTGSARNLAAAEVLSFLKQTRAAVPWTERDLAKVLNISMNEARRALAIMQFEGYVASAGGPGKWRTTPQEESVSGSKPPRFTRESVDKALSDLRERIRDTNNDTNALYKITDAVAFGDFLTDSPRVQSTTVGIRLVLRDDDTQRRESARGKVAESIFLKKLRGKGSLLHLERYEPWMGARSHRNLL